MAIQIEQAGKHLRITGNDPEKEFYARSRLSFTHEEFETFIELRFDGNVFAILDETTTDSTGTPIGLANLPSTLAAILDGSTEDLGSGEPEITVEDITAAVNAAAITLSGDNIDMSNADIVVNTQDIEDLLAEILTVETSNEAVTVETSSELSIISGTASASKEDFNIVVNGTSSVIVPADTDTIEVYIENKGSEDPAYIRDVGVATPDLSQTLFPGDSITLRGINSQTDIHAITDGSDVNLYVKRNYA